MFLSVIVFFLLLSTANCLLSQMENYCGPGCIFFFLRSLDQENLQRGDFFHMKIFSYEKQIQVLNNFWLTKQMENEATLSYPIIA